MASGLRRAGSLNQFPNIPTKVSLSSGILTSEKKYQSCRLYILAVMCETILRSNHGDLSLTNTSNTTLLRNFTFSSHPQRNGGRIAHQDWKHKHRQTMLLLQDYELVPSLNEIICNERCLDVTSKERMPPANQHCLMNNNNLANPIGN